MKQIKKRYQVPFFKFTLAKKLVKLTGSSPSPCGLRPYKLLKTFGLSSPLGGELQPEAFPNL